MPNIIQIEELVYTRVPRVSKSEWLKMLSKQGVANDYALLLDDYLLIEQTDYRFSKGNYISSERTVYNIDYTTYDTAENTPNPNNTEEIITVRYDSTHDRYYVYYTHFPIEDIPYTPYLSHILSEADIPSLHPFVQAPAEKHIDIPVTQRSVQPTPQPKPEPTPTPSFTSTEYHKPWRQKTLSELRRLYNSGKSLQELATIMDKFETSIVYQLKTYLGIEHPFEGTKRVSQDALHEHPWTQEQDRQLLEHYKLKNLFENFASEIGHTIPEIRARLYELVGLHNPFDPGMATRTEEQKFMDKQKWKWWLKNGVDILEHEMPKPKLKRKRISNPKTQSDKRYSPNEIFHHQKYGEVTVIKDTDIALVFRCPDGRKVIVNKQC